MAVLEPASSFSAQQALLAAAGAQVFFVERVGVSGGSPELERAIASLQTGDTIMVTRPYRVARSTRGVVGVIDRLGRKGIGFRILGTPVDTSTVTGRMIFRIHPALVPRYVAFARCVARLRAWLGRRRAKVTADQLTIAAKPAPARAPSHCDRSFSQ